jgi:hypothetical protein
MNYVEPILWAPSLAPEAYYQVGPVKDPPEDEDNLNYEPIEGELTEEETIQRPMATSETEEWAN